MIGPRFDDFEEKMVEFSNDHYMFKEMIVQADKNLSLKVNKTALIEQELFFKKNFLQISKWDGFTETQTGRMA